MISYYVHKNPGIEKGCQKKERNIHVQRYEKHFLKGNQTGEKYFNFFQTLFLARILGKSTKIIKT